MSYDPVGAALAWGSQGGTAEGFETNQYLEARNNLWNSLPAAARPYIDDPEIGPMLLSYQAGNIAWSDIQFAVLMKSNKIGPGGGGGGGGGGGLSKAQQAAQFKAEIGNMAGQMGLTGNYDALAEQAANNGWSIEMLRDMLAENITMETTKQAGLVQNVFDKARAAGTDYFLDVSDEQALGYAKRVARNELDEGAIVSDLRQQARERFFWLAPQIDQGATLKEIFQPQREAIGKLMDMNPDAVDFTHDMRWWNVLRMQQMDGTVRSMDIAETERFVRGLDEWKTTRSAKSQAAAATTALARTFGAM